ncbi:hypothetical protein JTB14_013403 [Gonioctena quinquepunctata]|nr:hypothetical protein JTB14_013403 [Gonioctena quinquepunctata]
MLFHPKFIKALGETKTAPAFAQTYSVKGVIHLPFAEIDEPFQAWYDVPSKVSRIDYYDGMVKTYQFASSGNGTILKIVPVTTEKVQNVETCFRIDGTEQNTFEIQPTLPSLDKFDFAGIVTIHGVEAEKWNLTEMIEPIINEYLMWIYKSDAEVLGADIAVPLRYEKRGYNTLLGSQTDHYYFDYESYDVNEISADIFKIPLGMTCHSFPGPGDRHLYTFNPMAEFIRPETSSHVDAAFRGFVSKHEKQYTDEKENILRKEIFRQNVRFIQSINRQNRGYTLAVNHLSDKTEAELEVLRGKTYSGVYNGGQPFPHDNIDWEILPDQFDWRLYGAVTPVKDQAVCGSCWAFGTVGAIEGAYFLKNGGKLVHLSQQALIDCSWLCGNIGCDGGEVFRSYQWMMELGGIPTEEDYGPYLGEDGKCHANGVPKVAKITGWVNVTTGDENALRLSIFNHGPISVSIDASHKTFSFYSNGVYYEPACGNKEGQLDHAVLAVGYGTMNGEDYWLIKNSWSNHWGNDGYVLMSARDNNCGVMTNPTYVVMA